MAREQIGDDGDVVTLVPENDGFHYGDAIRVCELINEHLDKGHRRFVLKADGLKDMSLQAIALLLEQVGEIYRKDGEFSVEGLSGKPRAIVEIYNLVGLVKEAG